MPLEHMQMAVALPRAERRQAGRSLRKIVPRSLHGQWTRSARRRDPVDLLVETGRHRIARLLPIRYDRMRASPIAFFRGAVAIMAADMADTPASGLWVQACGDCHLANFGVFASPIGNPMFDLNNFGETLPAPFEWDVKRLAASFAIDALSRGLGETSARQMAAQTTEACRRHLQELARLDPLRTWGSHVGVAELLSGIDDAKLRERQMR